MPSRAQIEASTPKCPARYLGDRRAIERCGQPLRYDITHGVWLCPGHGAVYTAAMLVAAQGGEQGTPAAA